MQIAIPQIPQLAQKQVTEKPLQINWGVANTFHGIPVICTDQRIAEVPGMVCEHIVVYLKSDIPQIKNRKNGRRTGITLTKA